MTTRSRAELYEQIRKVHYREGVSIRELGRRFRVHRRDVRRALESPLPPPRQAPPARPSLLDEWKPTIDAWLEADRTAPRKQRHTARRVWERLRDEHDVVVGESTVRRYVTDVRRRQEVPLAEVMVPQRHVLGEEGEVDFGTITVEVGGLVVEVQLFLMRLSASGRTFTRAYLNECQEVFLDGHVRAFEHFGGVPARIRFDNLKSAVTRVLKGRDRVESERFVAMRSHYGFDSFFCQPGIKGAHEKGGVEGEVGRFRRRHLVPVPKVASLAELNERLAATIATLAGCAYLDAGEPVVLLGDSGTGKSHVLIGLGVAACEQGRRVRYATAAQLVNELVEAADERRLSRLVARYGRLDLLCLDELGYVQLDSRGAELLFQILTEREEKASIAVASNLPFSEWGQVIADPRLVAAIVDRVTFNAHIIETGTDSYRLRTTKAARARKKTA